MELRKFYQNQMLFVDIPSFDITNPMINNNSGIEPCPESQKRIIKQERCQSLTVSAKMSEQG